MNIVAEGFARRTVALPGLEAGNYGGLAAAEGAVYYITAPAGSESSLARYDLEAREEEIVAEGVGQFVLGDRGKNVLFPTDGGWSIA